MRIKIGILILFILFYFASFSQVQINSSERILQIGKNVFLYEDATSKFDIEHIASDSFAKNFRKSKIDVPNFGLTNSTIWCKIEINNKTDKKNWYLEVGNPVLDTVILFVKSEKGNFNSEILGYYKAFHERKIQTSNFYYLFTIEPHSTGTLFLKIKCEKALNFPITIIPESRFIEYNHLTDLALGLYYGLIVVMFLYNLFIYISIRDRNYLYYILFILSIGLTNADLKGTAFELLWPNCPEINPYLPLFGNLSGVFAMLFVRNFLELKKNSHKYIYRTWFFIFGTYIVAVIFSLLKETTIAVLIVLYTTLLASLYSLFVGFYLYFKKYKPAKFYLIAWTWVFIGVSIYVLMDFGLISYNYLTANAMIIGSGMEIIFLAIALADKINILENEKKISQQLALEQAQQKELFMQEQNEILEQRVKERTAEIEQQNEEIQSQAEYLQQINGELTKRNEQIEIVNSDLVQKNLFITNSIAYALRIQNAVFPNQQLLECLLPSHFILHKARNVVSGDFYFVKQVKNITLLAVADCTGHGIPGAFMSMLGIALLNEIVRRPEITKASIVLEELRKQIKNALQQTGKHYEPQDGMDIAFCAIDLETMQMSFAGAYNSLCLFRKNIAGDYELIELHADRQPVGVHHKEKPFTEHNIQLESGDVFYLYTDGYYSQFGGENNYPLKSKHFKELLSKNCHLPLTEQFINFENKYTDWKGNNTQTDDVLVMGIKI